MRSLLRPLLVITLILLVPILPFVAFGPSLEAEFERWLDVWSQPAPTAALIVSLLTTDVFLPVPSSLVSTLGGSRLGWHLGTLASWIGMNLGAVLGFALARRWGRPFAAWLSSEEELAGMEKLSHRYGAAILVFTRAIPILAEASVLLMGVQRLSWRSFLAPVLLSNLGIALAYSTFGDLAAAHHWLPLALGISLALPLLLVALLKPLVIKAGE